MAGTSYLYSFDSTLNTVSSIDLIASFRVSDSNDSINGFVIFNDSTTDNLKISTVSSTDANAFTLKPGEYMGLDIFLTNLFLINASLNTIPYRAILKAYSKD